MRKRALLVLCLPAAWLACFSNDSGGGLVPSDGGVFDASSDASFDSAPLPDVSTTGLDAAEEPDAAPSAVVITVVGANGVEPGIPVAFADSTGAATGSQTTNALGQVTATLAAGSMVTVLFGTPALPTLVTYTAVQPGDAILAIDTTSIPGIEAMLTSLPNDPPEGTVDYSVRVAGCYAFFDSTPNEFQVQPKCVGVVPQGTSYAAAFPIVVDANDDDGNLLGFTYQKIEPTASADAGALSFALGGAWSTATTTQTVSVSNEPDGGLAGGDDAQLRTTYSEGIDTRLSAPPAASVALSDGGYGIGWLTHVGFADFVQAEAVQASSDGPYAVAVATRSAPPTADGDTAIDLTLAAALPVFTETTADFTTMAQPVISWTVGGGATSAATALIASVTFSSSLEDGSTQDGRWTIVSPGTTASSLQAPALPAACAAYAPNGTLFAGDQVGGLYALQGSALPTLSAARDAVSLFPAPDGCLPTPLIPALPVAGALALSIGVSRGCG